MQRAHVECLKHAWVELLITHCPVLMQHQHCPHVEEYALGRTIHSVDFGEVIHAR